MPYSESFTGDNLVEKGWAFVANYYNTFESAIKTSRNADYTAFVSKFYRESSYADFCGNGNTSGIRSISENVKRAKLPTSRRRFLTVNAVPIPGAESYMVWAVGKAQYPNSEKQAFSQVFIIGKDEKGEYIQNETLKFERDLGLYRDAFVEIN